MKEHKCISLPHLLCKTVFLFVPKTTPFLALRTKKVVQRILDLSIEATVRLAKSLQDSEHGS